MQFIQHDFFVNFDAAFRSKDREMLDDLLNDEISKLIVFDKERLVKALSECNVPVDPSVNNTALAKLVNTNLRTNKTLRKRVVKLILLNNNSTNRDIKGKLGLQKMLDQSLYMSFNGANEPLLLKKMETHSRQKGFVNLNEDDDTVKGWKAAKVVAMTAVVTAIGLTTAFLIARYFWRKHRDKKAAAIPGTAVASTTEASTDKPIPQAEGTPTTETVTK